MPSVAVRTRLISSVAVSPPCAAQAAQMRPSMYFALSAVGATRSAANRRSRFWSGSPRCARGRSAGGSTGCGGSAPGGAISGVCACDGAASVTARAMNAKARQRVELVVHATEF